MILILNFLKLFSFLQFVARKHLGLYETIAFKYFRGLTFNPSNSQRSA